MSFQAQGLVRGLDMKAPLKPILMAYANYADELGYVLAGVECIAFDTGYSVTAVKDARKTLIDGRWMASKRRFGTSSIVRLNLDLMADRQVDRSEGKRIHPELEFTPETPRSGTNSRVAANCKPAGQARTAATRLTEDPLVGHEQPPRGSTVSRVAAVGIAATRPLSISDPSDDPSVDARDAVTPQAGSPSIAAEAAETDGRMDLQPHEQPTPAMDLVLSLDFGKHIRPTRAQADALAQLVDDALKTGLDLRLVRHHAQTKIGQARRNAVTYLLRGLAPDELPVAPARPKTPRSAPTARTAPATATPVGAPADMSERGLKPSLLPTRLREAAAAEAS